ncbi:MAG: FecR domain-containing protein [Rhodopirellula sp.]|nr:FecR domain-containing protein [Rhodopirellula sp.]
MNEHNERDELFRHRIKAALQQLNAQTNGYDSYASIEAELAEAELAEVDAAPLDESAVRRIMNQVHDSIYEAARSREGANVMQNRTSPRINAPVGKAGHSLHLHRRHPTGSAAIVAVVTTSLCLLTAYVLFQVSSETPSENPSLTSGTPLTYEFDRLSRSSHQFRYVALPRPQAAPPERLIVGQTIRTAARERRRALLPDGSILYLNEQSTVALTANRTVSLHRGQLFIEVTPANISDQGRFVVQTPDRSVTALGTKFAVSTGTKETEVLVTQGKVRVSGAKSVLTGGQVAGAADKNADVTIDAAPRASQALSWTRELMAAAETSLVPRSKYDGGSLLVIDPTGQEMKLSLRKFHVDAHIEDGFARTTIDQTYFNHTHSRQEGTFHFPLPPDASLSRLAMYVNGKMMEGGMVERDHGRNVFEQIMHTKRDPALLEWVDGSTFKMRVFPLEPRQEKRIVLSYTQRLPNDYDRTVYRFPAGHNLDQVRDWSTRLTVANGAGNTRWFSPTHLLQATESGDNLVLEGDLQNAVLDKDLVVELTAADTPDNTLSRRVRESISFSEAEHEGHRYQMLRFRPNFHGELKRPRRNWVFLFESSGDRNPLLARVQLDVISTMLEHAEHDDTFSVISAATNSKSFRLKPVRCSKKNIEKAVTWLEDAHLVGALNLEEAFTKSKPFCRRDGETILVHLGSATPVLGERDTQKLLRILPADVPYVGVGVGKRWSRSFMKSAAGRSGGHFTQINPDEKVSWRAFELLSTMNAPRLLNLKIDSGRKSVQFLTFAETIAHGQEIAAITRLPLQVKPLDTVTVTGTLNGQPFRRKLKVENVIPQADYLPRTWARLEIDRLVADGAAAHKDAIITLSKAMYVMSPFTSLLVLEDEAMYEQFHVDRGRKDHWALYPAPQTIQVVHEPGPTLPAMSDSVEKLEQKLHRLNSKRDAAQANLDRGLQDRRRPAEIEKLNSQLASWQHEVEQQQNRLQLAQEAANNKVNSVIQSVLYRRPPSITVAAASLRTRFLNRRFDRLSWNRNTASGFDGDVDFRLPSRFSLLPGSDFLNYWGVQQTANPVFWNENSNGNGVLDESIITIRNDADFYDPSISRGTVTFDGKDFGDGFRWEFTPRLMTGLEEPALDGILGAQRRGVNQSQRDDMADSRWYFSGRNQGLDLSFGRSSALGLDLADVTYVGNSLRAVRPELALQQQELTRWLGVLPASQPVNNSSFEIINFTDDFGNQSITRTLPGLSDTFSRNSGSASELIPVVPSHNTLIERYDVSERYGKVPILDHYGIGSDRSGYRYISSNSPDVDLDEISQFHVTHPDFGTVSQVLSEEFIRRELVSLNSLGFVTQREYDSQLAAIRLRLSNQNSQGLYSSQSELIQLPIQRPGILRNILSYAPGLQTSTADVLAVVADEVEADGNPVRGAVDAGVLNLIEKCRSLGWEELTFASTDHDAATKMFCNGEGEIRLERRTVDGLLEQIISDGKTLQHLYPELGVGSKRTISRFHRQALLRLTPWLVLPAEDLSIGGDVRLVGDNTIRITRVRPTRSDEKEEDKANHEPREKSELAVELVIGNDGRVTERRLVKLTTKPERNERVLLREVYEASGTIRILDRDDKLLKEVKLQRKSIANPPAASSTDGIVVLPLPYRSADSYSLTLTAQPASNGSVDYSQLSESDAMKLVATHVANSDFDALWNVINPRFVSKDDCRMGFAVLLSGAAAGNSQPIHEVASHNQGPSALGSFLVQHFDWWQDQNLSKEFVLPDSASPFLKHLADAHNLFALWSSGRATQDRTEAQVDQELSRAIELIRTCRSKQVAWSLLNVVHKSIDETFSKKKLHLRLAKDAAAFEDVPGLFGPACYARVLWLLSAGKDDEAKSLYGSFRRDATVAGFTPTASEELRSAFKAATGSSDEWSKLIINSAEPLIEQKRSLELLQLALQCATIAEPDTARQLLNKGVAEAQLSQRPDLLITGLQCLITIDDWERAEDFTRQLMNYRNASEHASLWRTASQIATALGNDDESLRRLEQAMRLEFSSLPDSVNVEALRADYNKLFDRFTTFAAKAIADGEPLPKDFVERVTQAADAWRSIDPDPTAACQRAARLLQLVGLYDQAWEYWTTPLVNTASNAAAWKSLALALAETDQVHRASQAWSEAFAAEPTDPEILWNHATLLRDHNQPERAKRLLTQIMNGNWQPRFEHFKLKAKSLLQKL